MSRAGRSATRPGRSAARRARALVAVLALAAPWGVASAPPDVGFRAGDAPRFDLAWRVVAERYWDLSLSAIDWQEARVLYGDRRVPDDAALDALIEAMFEAIGDDHTRYVPAARVAEERERFGDLPCIGFFGAAQASAASPAPEDAPPDLDRAGPVHVGVWDDGVGYLRVPDLVQDGVAEGVRRAVGALERDGVRALVLDLRGNPGGRLVTMMQVAGVFTRGFLWRALTRWSLPLPYPALGAPATELPLAVLVDGDVHSAAEGLAGGLQAQGRAVVVGAASAGNVEAVLPFCLRDGAQAWVATGVLAPLNGPSWEGRGVTPDVPSDPTTAATIARATLLGR